MTRRLKQRSLITVAVTLLVYMTTVAADTDCNDEDLEYSIACNPLIDPWKPVSTKIQEITPQIEVNGGYSLWVRLKNGKTKAEAIVNTLNTAKDITDKAIKYKVEQAADAAEASAEVVADSAKKASTWLLRGAKLLNFFSSASQYVGPIIDIILLFQPLAKSAELKAIESGFAKMGAKIDSIAYQLEHIEDALDWNAIVGNLMEFEANVKTATQQYKHLAAELNATDLTQEPPLSVKGHIENLVNTIKNSADIGNKLELAVTLFQGTSAFSKGKTLIEIFVDAVDNDCSMILPMTNKFTSIVKDAQRLQYFYEINQKLVEPSDDKGYPKMLYEMYKQSMNEYSKCTKNAATYAQEEMKILYNNDKALTEIIDKMESKYDLYNWMTIKEEDKEEEAYALIDNSGRKMDIELTGLSEDDQKKKVLTLFAVKKSSVTEVDNAVAHLKKVLVSLKYEELPGLYRLRRLTNGSVDENYGIPHYSDYSDWDADQTTRDDTILQVQDLLRKDEVLENLIDNNRLTIVMFKEEASISLTGWHYISNMEVLEKSLSRKTYEHNFTVGFMFSFEGDRSSFTCNNGNTINLSFDGSFPYCLCEMGYGGESCDISLKQPSSSSEVSNFLLDLIKKYKVPGMFDLQDDIRKGTEKIMNEIENNKQEIFTVIRQSSNDVEKSKNAIISAQSIMFNELKAVNSRVLKGMSALRYALEAAFDRERNDRLYSTAKGQKIVLGTIRDANKKVTDSIGRLSGLVVENRYFKELKLHIPVYQEKFDRAIDFKGFAENDFSNYLRLHEQNFQAAKKAARKAIVEESDSFLLAQMKINMISGCTDAYNSKINSTWSELIELNLAMNAMELWDLKYRIGKSQQQNEIKFLEHEKSLLQEKANSDADEFNEVKTRSCPSFSLPELLGGGCDSSVTYPGQSVPMSCIGPNQSLILLSTGVVIKHMICKSDSTWAVDVEDLACVSQCQVDGNHYDIGDKLQLIPEAGYHFEDKDGNVVTESTCLPPEPEEEDLNARWSITLRKDTNECAEAGFCRHGGACINTPGSFTCSCPTGFADGSDGKCEDVDECSSGEVGYNKCLVQSSLGRCENTEGSYRCSCLSGSYTNTRHGGKECVACSCNRNGVTRTVCNAQTGACLCRTNVGGADCGSCKAGFTNFPYCNQCAPAYYGYPNCARCSCTAAGVTAQYCNPYTGTCECKANVGGSQCERCLPQYKNYPACIKDIRDGTLSSWGSWSAWTDQETCGPSYRLTITQKRTRKRTCNNDTKNIHGRSCTDEQQEQTKVRYACQGVTDVYIKLADEYWAPTTGELWMSIRQGNTQCTTRKPTWDAPKDWAIGYNRKAFGCSTSFDIEKPVELYLHSDSSNEVWISRMSIRLNGGHWKLWYAGSTDETWIAISKNKSGWHTAYSY